MDNELKVILEQIVSGQQKLEQGQQKLEHEVTGVSQRLGNLEQGQQKLEHEVTGVSQKLDKLEQGQQKLEHEVTGVSQRLDKLEHEVTGVSQRLDKLEQGQQKLEHEVTGVSQRLDKLEQGQEVITLELADVKKLATKTSIIQELEVTKKIQLIYENQVTIIEHNKQLDGFKNNLENVETDVFALKIAVKQLQTAK